ncbi:hypothetical protein H6G81_35375 [Scytonema hofmannii FACHB-248]|uniref:Uncharacterized protein n=1 Tax=Scytonema hofmannii FACHB-248 TaxID=1842502 RepID=A0ABR8H1C5_9CYAN|nr:MULTISPECIES: hypothetical protein [Nostocales]MBD2609630.1 hypothetical protein [Scytonema hofmannii FACHB-248]
MSQQRASLHETSAPPCPMPDRSPVMFNLTTYSIACVSITLPMSLEVFWVKLGHK